MDAYYHFIGIGGIGMSALAHLLIEKGKQVSGSDLTPSLVTDALLKKNADVVFGHSPHHVKEQATVIYSTDIKETNPEIQRAKELHLPLIHRSQLLSDLMRGYHPLLVAGSHGKTTTSSLLAHLLVEASLNPCYAVGGIVASLKGNGGYGTGEYFIAEADESDGSFLNYSPYGAILTNVGKDHLDYWKSETRLQEGFLQFAKKISRQDYLFWCGEDPILSSFSLQGHSYGFHPSHSVFITRFSQVGWKIRFDLVFQGISYKEIEIPLIGIHNVLNSASVFAMGLQLNLSEEKIRHAFLSFQGIARRMQLKEEMDSILIFDDYAHHPTEIQTTLEGLRHALQTSSSCHRLVVAFQPHRYTRTKDCFSSFGPAFKAADLLILTDIYSAREAPIEGVTTEALLKKIKTQIGVETLYVERTHLSQFLREILQPKDVLITMGAGDVTHVGSELKRAF